MFEASLDINILKCMRTFDRWGFLKSAETICKQDFAEKLPRASVQDLGVVLMGAGYEVHYCKFYVCKNRFSVSSYNVSGIWLL